MRKYLIPLFMVSTFIFLVGIGPAYIVKLFLEAVYHAVR